MLLRPISSSTNSQDWTANIEKASPAAVNNITVILTRERTARNVSTLSPQEHRSPENRRQSSTLHKEATTARLFFLPRTSAIFFAAATVTHLVVFYRGYSMLLSDLLFSLGVEFMNDR
jgi:hypothetical protein